MSRVKFGKIENNPTTSKADVPDAIEMGISNAPARLIVKYITDMYSHPLEAAIRETVANAFDASRQKHGFVNGVSARIDESDPIRHFFEVKDDGEGMTYEQLVSVYTQYGVSDKRDAENLTGAFGLGAKAPLAYAREFQIITKTDVEGCYLTYAYRTDDDDFLATQPVRLQGNPIDVADPLTGEISSVADPFEPQETGSIVRFPIRTSDESAYGNDSESAAYPGYVRLRKKNGDNIRAARILADMSKMVYNTNGFVIDTKEISGKPAYYHIGTYSFSDDDGDSIELSVYLTGGDSALFGKGRNERLLRCALNSQNTFLDEEIAFKVDNWLYPADGSAWALNLEGFCMSDSIRVIVDVPSRALPFVPSRDTILNDSPNIAALRSFAIEKVRSHFADPALVSDVFNWLMDGKPIGTAFPDILAPGDFYLSSVPLDLSKPVTFGYALRTGYYTAMNSAKSTPKYAYLVSVDATKLEAFGNVLLPEALDTTNVLCGQLHRSGNTTKMKAGPLLVSENLLPRLFGGGYDESLRSTRYHVKSTFDGYGLASKGVVGDTLVSLGHTCQDDIDFSLTSKKPSSQPLTYAIPYGLALAHVHSGCELAYQRSLPIFIVDASQRELSKVRVAMSKIFDNLISDKNIEDGIFLLLPRKSVADNWSAQERKDILADIKRMALLVSDTVHVIADAAIDKLSKKAKNSDVRKTSELEKMTRTNRIVGYEYSDMRGNTVKRLREETMKAPEVVAAMSKDPSHWGIVSADCSYEKPHEIAQRYAMAMYALNLIDSDMSMVCIPSNRLTPQRAKMVEDMGCSIIYDETGSSGCSAVFPRGTFENIGTSLGHIRYRGELDDAVKAYLIKSDSDDERKAMETLFKNTFRNNEGMSWISPRSMKYDVDKLIDFFSFGRESYRILDADSVGAGPTGWMKNMFKLIEIDEGTDAESFKESSKRVSEVLSIWKTKLGEAACHLHAEDFDEKHLRLLKEVAIALGIDSAVDAYYTGTPLEHING